MQIENKMLAVVKGESIIKPFSQVYSEVRQRMDKEFPVVQKEERSIIYTDGEASIYTAVVQEFLREHPELRETRKRTKMSEPRNGRYERDAGDFYWYRDDRLHREDGPAVELKSGVTEWYIDGKRHRIDGPAVDFGMEGGYGEWYQNGLKHREDGPAVFLPLEHAKIEEYWIHGELLTKKEFLQYCAKKAIREHLQSELQPKRTTVKLKV